MASILLLLAWVASVDGKVDDSELGSLRQFAGEAVDHSTLHRIIGIAQGARVEDLQLACEIIQKLSAEKRKLVLNLTMGMALEDGVLTAAESHIIRLVADIALVPPRILGDLFREMTGRNFPPPSDLSDPEWWRQAESRQSKRQADTKQPGRDGFRSDELQRLKDLAVLGLEEGATEAEIKLAYRRIAQVHHPDKYASLGNEAVKSAEATFRRIQAAYERLLNS